MPGAAYTFPSWVDKLTVEDAVKLILVGFFGTTAPSGSGGGVVVTPQSVTNNVASKTAGQSGTIPAGAKGWTFIVFTGTATFNGAAGVPAGTTLSDPNTLTSAINYSFDTPGTGIVMWNT